MAKLSTKRIKQIRAERKAGASIHELSRKYGHSRVTISKYCKVIDPASIPKSIPTKLELSKVLERIPDLPEISKDSSMREVILFGVATLVHSTVKYLLNDEISPHEMEKLIGVLSKAREEVDVIEGRTDGSKHVVSVQNIVVSRSY